MGLLDKLKNVFFEEEYVEVEEEAPKEPKVTRKKEENVAPKQTVARRIDVSSVAKRREKEVEEVPVLEEKEESRTEILTDKELLKPDSSFHMFEDEDFAYDMPHQESPQPVKKEEPSPKIETLVSSSETHRVPYGGAYSTDYSTIYHKAAPKSEEKTFHPTPIISPIYGILDKNYKKDDIVEKNAKNKNASSYAKKIDLDEVRKKAYGELSNDLGLTGEDPISETNTKEEEPMELEDNLLYDLRDTDQTPVVDKVTIADAEEYFQDLGLEYNVDYKDREKERSTGKRVARRSTTDLKETHSPVKKEVREESKNDTELEDNLFDLIDSMYEEKE